VNLIFHARTKHIEVNDHFVRDSVAKKEIQIHFISSYDQLVDVFTKSLPTVFFLLLFTISFGSILYSWLEGAYIYIGIAIVL
jgi:hypothetical protein